MARKETLNNLILFLFFFFTGMYPLSFVSGRDGNLPQCNYQLHETNSNLVRAMNLKLQELGGLGMADHYNKDSEQRNVTYLIEVRISYPQKIHLELHDPIPSIYRRTIPLDQLSQAQREYAARFNITPDTTKPVVTQDFLPQTTIVSVAYLALLGRLGVQIHEVFAIMTAFEAPIFRATMQKMLDLKASATNAYFRQLAKMW